MLPYLLEGPGPDARAARPARPRGTPSSRVRFSSFIDATGKRRQGVQELHLAGEAPEEERDAAPNVHRVLVTLNWRKHLPFDLAYTSRPFNKTHDKEKHN